MYPSCAEYEELPPPPAAPPLLGSCRLTLVVLSFLAVFHMMLLRFNISMGLICMVRGGNNTNNSAEDAKDQFGHDVS